MRHASVICSLDLFEYVKKILRAKGFRISMNPNGPFHALLTLEEGKEPKEIKSLEKLEAYLDGLPLPEKKDEIKSPRGGSFGRQLS